MHLHSSSCFSSEWSDEEDFIDAIVGSSLEVVAITDHNVIDDELLERLQKAGGEKKRKEGALHCFCGVELNLFLTQDTIKVNKLTTRAMMRPNDYCDDTDYFQAVMLFSFSDRKKAAEKMRELTNVYYPDTNQLGVAHEVSKELSDKRFPLDDVLKRFSQLRYFLIFHEGKSQDRNLSDYLPKKDHGRVIKNNRHFKESMFFYNNAFAFEGWHGDSYSNLLEQEVQTLVAGFLFSDSKKKEDLERWFTWINFDGSFESLILPISDPETRVFPSLDDKKHPVGNPQSNIKDSYLRAIEISLLDGKKQVIYFSPGYNGIIGSRGGGKSLLAAALSGKNIDNYSDFLTVDSVRYLYSNSSSYESKPVEANYLSQGEFNELFIKGQYKELDLLRDQLKILSADKKKENADAVAKISDALELQEERVDAFFDMHKGVLDNFDFLREDTSSPLLLAGFEMSDYPDAELEIDSMSKRLEEVIQSIDKAICSLRKITPLERDYSEVRDLSIYSWASVEQVRRHLIIEKGNLASLLIELKDANRLPFVRRKQLLERLKKKIDDYNKYDNAASVEYQHRRSELVGFLKDCFMLRKAIAETDETIDRMSTVLEQPSGSAETCLRRADSFPRGRDSVRMQVHCQVEAPVLEVRNSQFIKATNHRDALFEALLDIRNDGLFKSHFNKIKFRNATTSKEILEKYYQNLKGGYERYSSPEAQLEYRETEGGNYVELSKLSPGKRAEVLLKVFLVGQNGQTSSSLIMDQPDDNLDTRTITNTLVKCIRREKCHHQLFIISHSAAVIVNGDANNVIIGSADLNNHISYQQGSVYSKEIKNSITEILDGGETYLKARFNKYNFSMRPEDSQ
jgi:energy-coupling factor transporter ATP-binding protein EcfA2